MRAPGPRVARPLRPRPAAGRGTPVENRGTALRRDLCRPPEREPTGGATSPAGSPRERRGLPGNGRELLEPPLTGSLPRMSASAAGPGHQNPDAAPPMPPPRSAPPAGACPPDGHRALSAGRVCPAPHGLSPAQQREALRAPPHLKAPTTASARLRALVHRVVRWAFARVYEGPWGRGLLQTAHWSAPGARRTMLVASGLPFPPTTCSPARGGRVAHT